MKYVVWFIFFIANLTSFGQKDSSDVFIVEDSSNSKDEIVMVNERTTFKFDLAKAYMGQSLFSIEHLFKNNKSSIEPEIVLLLTPYEWVFNYYTKNKPTNNSDSINISLQIQFGLGLGYKKYINKNKEGLFGHYIGVKLRSKFGLFDQSKTPSNKDIIFTNNTISINIPSYNGWLNVNELSVYYGYSFWVYNLAQIDPFIGLSIAVAHFKYGEYQQPPVNSWNPNTATIIRPSIIFGFRVGFSSSIRKLFSF